jgi:hypothetical protein
MIGWPRLREGFYWPPATSVYLHLDKNARLHKSLTAIKLGKKLSS